MNTLIEIEQYALVQYLINNHPGPIIRQIIEDRLSFLEGLKYNLPDKSYKSGNTVACFHKPTFKEYNSVAEAARDLGVNYFTLKLDIDTEKCKYGVYRL